jgi:hypothetical protein
MNDQELAKSIEALGIGRPTEYITPQGDDGWWEELNDYDFVRDWRVAGALMERVPTVELAQLVNSQGFAAQAIVLLVDYDHVRHDDNSTFTKKYLAKCSADDDCLYREARDESAPRAICEACVEALETDDE